MRRYFIALLFCQLSLYAIAQSGVSMSLFSGRMSYSIPIYTVEDPDFPLDIALRYSTEGFKPFQPSGCYGQDWTLVAGGCITRTIQGIPDDLSYYGQITKWWYRHNTNEKISLRGYIVGWEKGLARAMMLMGASDSIPAKEEVFSMNSTVYNDSCGINFREGMLIDYMPDIFHFNFCGHNGHFIINNSGKPIIIDGDFVDIDISEIGTNRSAEYDEFEWNLYQTVPKGFLESHESSQIVIKTTDGYIYVFGGANNGLGYSIATRKDSVEKEAFSVVNAWHLMKIKAPNGRILNFDYVWSGYVDDLHKRSGYLHSFVTDYDWAELAEDTVHIVYSLRKECLLRSITTSDSIPLTISFFSSENTEKKYNHNDFTMCKPHLRLDSIIVSYNGDTLKKATMSYQYRSTEKMLGAYPNYWWRYLSQVTISGIGKYRMTYNEILFDSGIQNYHFYTTIYPSLYPQTDENYKNMVDRFGFWKRTSLQGLLSEVALPTGGKIKFTYGEHQYGEERRFRAVGTKNVELYTQLGANQTIGGARIEQVETYSDDSTLVETKTFSYNKQGTDNSSGIYYNIYNVFYPDTLCPVINPFNYGLVDSHIGYSYVEQQTTMETDNSYKTTYTFDTGRRTYSSLNNSLINRNDEVPDYKDTTEICSGSLTFDGWLMAPGKLLRTDMYKGTTLAKTVQYQYNGVSESSVNAPSFETNSLGCTDTIVCLSKYSAHVARKLLVCPNVLEKITTQEYSPNGQMMESTVSYIHDQKLRVTEEKTTDSRNRQLFTRYTYPDNISAYIMVPMSPLRQLYLKNRIGCPVETIYGYIDDDTEYVTGGSIDIYANNVYIENGEVRLKPYLSKVYTLALSNPITDYQHMRYLNNLLDFDEHYTTTAEYRYDLQNRLLWVKPFGQASTTYTWDGIYPVTKTIGNQTWTYTYKPYVGVKSVTDPRGITTYYTYDKNGKLIEEYRLVNGKKHILNAYQYHIKTE